MLRTVLFVLKGYPRLSETFIAQEIRSLEKLGLSVYICALRRPTDDRVHPVHREIEAPVLYLPEYLHDDPARVLRALLWCMRQRGFARALRAFAKDVWRDFSRNRFRRFGQGCVMAAEMPPDTGRLHAHFIHTPASATRYASLLTAVPWSISAHAKDIWTSSDWELREKLAEADWTVTCTKAGQARLNELAPIGNPVRLVYHGLDLTRFPALLTPRPERDGRDPAKPVRLLTVARAVEKKGLDTLIAALATLPRELNWTWTHVGGGERVAQLKEQAAAAGLADRCLFRGAQDQSVVLDLYRASDLFVLPCRIASDGDRDGLPNVLVEAASQGLCALSTAVSGVVELIDDGVNGALVAADDVPALASRLAGLMADPSERYRLGKAAMLRVRSTFDHATTITALWALFAADAVGRDATAAMEVTS